MLQTLRWSQQLQHQLLGSPHPHPGRHLGTSVSTWTQMCPCQHTFHELFWAVSASCARYGASRWDFRCRWNDDRVDAAVTVGGRLFQALVSAAEKDRSPSIDLRVAGMTNADELEDLRHCLLLSSFRRHLKSYLFTKSFPSWRWLLLDDSTRCDCVKYPCSFQLCHFNQFFFYITLIASSVADQIELDISNAQGSQHIHSDLLT